MKEFKIIYLKLLTIIILIPILGCNDSNKQECPNKEMYKVKIGESFKIYYNVSSCCYYCWINEKEIKSVKLLERILVEEGPEDCIGCASKYAFIFKALESGTDTLKLSFLTATDTCDGKSADYDQYIVNVSK
jgi:predicted secreted protein